jgi:tRNA threonylcarbamoyladenosine biosynthesis protein TsaE
MMIDHEVCDEAAMLQFAGQFAKQDLSGLCIYLRGDLGLGKTTFVRGILQAKEYEGVVKSPTYTLVEPYDMLTPKIYHFDLYRLRYPEELEDIGIKDYFQPDSCCLIEWPEQGEAFLPAPDIEIRFMEQEPSGRMLRLQASNVKGTEILKSLQTYPR